MYTSSTDVKVRKVAYSVLCQVVVLAHSSSDEIVAQLELPTLSKQLFEVLAKTESSDSSIVILFCSSYHSNLISNYYYACNFLIIARNRFLILLGRLAQYFPNVLEENASRLINQIIYELDKQVNDFFFLSKV